MRQDILAEFVDYFRGMAALGLEMQGDVIDSLILLALPELDQLISTGAQYASWLYGMIGILARSNKVPYP